MLRQKLLFVLSLVLLILMNGRAAPVSACTATPTGRPGYTLAEKVSDAPIILEGTVTAVVERSASSYQDIATVSVVRYFKGIGPDTVEIGNFGSSAQCLTTVSVGEHGLFYASGDPYTRLRATYKSAFVAVSSADADSIAALTAITGEPTAPQNKPTTRSTADNGRIIPMLIGIVASVIVGIVLWILR